MRNILRNIILIILAISVIGFAGAQKELQSPPGTLDGINPSLSMQTQRDADTLIYNTIMQIEWLATDSSFTARPIHIGYIYPDQPGTDILIDSVANTGTFDWTIPSDINGVIRLFVETIDRFGNSTRQLSAPQTIIGTNPGPCWYVNLTGNDSHNNGTANFPYATIEKALRASNSGDSIFIASGEFVDSRLNDFGKNLYITSLGGIKKTHIHLGAPITLSGNTVITGFWIEGVNACDTAVQIIGGKAQIINNWFYNHPMAIVCAGNSQAHLQNNLIYNANIGILCQDQSETEIFNNTIVSGRTGIEIAHNQAKVKVLNNIISDNTGTGAIVASAPGSFLEIRYNNLCLNAHNYVGLDDKTGSDGNISEDPLFISDSLRDYYLSPISTSINIGDPSSGYNLEPEPNGDRINLGFYGGTSLAEIAALKFTTSVLTIISEDSLYEQASGILPDSNVVFNYQALAIPAWLSLTTSNFLRGTPRNQHVGNHPVSIRVADNFNRTDTMTYNLEVLNSPALFTSQPDTTALEDELYSYNAQTSDEGQGAGKYALIQPAWLSIDSLNGVVSGTPTNDLVGKHSVKIQFDDGNGSIIQQQFILIVTNVNDPPVLSHLPDLNASEDTPISQPLSAWQSFVTDPDNVFDELHWKIQNSAHLMASITNDTIKIMSTQNWYGTENLTVIVNDEVDSSTNFVRIGIASVADAPQIFLPLLFTCNEDETLKVSLDSIVRDVDTPPAEMIWTITPKDESLFTTLDHSKRLLYLWGAPNYFADSLRINYSVKDDSGLTATGFNYLNILPVNDPPQIPPILTWNELLYEDRSFSIDLKQFYSSAIDPETQPADLNWILSDGKKIFISMEVGPHEYLLASPQNYFGYDTLLVRISDGEYTGQSRLPLYLNPLNDPPVIVALPDTAFNEDDTLTIQLNELASDVDSPINTLTWQITLGTLTSPLGFDLEKKTNIVKFFGLPNESTTGVPVYYSVSDDSGATTSDTNFVAILPVNDPPLMIAVPDTSFLEDERLVINHDVWQKHYFDPDNDYSELTLQISKDSGVVFYNFNAYSNQDEFWNSPNVNGTGYFTLTVSDPDNQKLIIPLKINIIPINDPPMIKAWADTSLAQGLILEWRLRQFGSDIDNQYSELTWDFQTKITTVIYEPRSDTLRLIPPDGFVGCDTVVCKLSDPSGLTVKDTFIVRYIDTIPPDFIIGIFQNPIASQYLDFYFFPSEPIGSFDYVNIGNHSNEVTLIADIEPNPYHCHYQLFDTTNYTVQISASDTAGNNSLTLYDFSASQIYASRGGILISPDSLVKVLIPPKSLEHNQFILCLPDASEKIDTKALGKVTLSKIKIKQSSKSYRFVNPDGNITKLLKIQFDLTPDQIHENLKKTGIFYNDNNCWQYQTTYTDESFSTFWIYTDKLGEYKLSFDAPNNPITLPTKVSLAQNYPNPFNPTTTINFFLPELGANQFDAPAILTVYDLLGRQVVKLHDKRLPPGHYSVIWSGNNMQGQPVASGIYIYALTYGNQLKSKKMVMIK